MKFTITLFPILFAFAVHAGEQPYGRPAGIAGEQEPLIVAGYRALFTCSAHFIAGRDLKQVRMIELVDVEGAGYPDPVIDETLHTVTAANPSGSITRLAAWRNGMGCTVLPSHWTSDQVSQLPDRPADPAPDLGAVPFPAGDRVELPDSGVDAGHAALAPIIERAFDGNSYGGPGDVVTISTLIVKDGRLLVERYRDGFGIHAGYRTWSTAKSISAALIGIAQRKGVLDSDGPADVPEWNSPGDPRRAITYRHLLWMSSGLHSGGSNANAVYFGGQDVVSAVTTTQLEAPPGTRWKYANNDTLLLLRALRHRLGDDRAYLDFPYRELFQPLGMHHTRMETDHLGNFVGSSQVYTTSRDLARFGLLLLNDGVWNGVRLLPEGWVKFMATPAPAMLPEAGEWRYGAQLWLLGHLPGIPEGTFSTAGRKGQYVTVVPTQGLVIVRTGVDPEGRKWLQDRFVADIVAAIAGASRSAGAASGRGIE